MWPLRPEVKYRARLPGPFFAAGSNGHLWENYWNQATSQWLWSDHGQPAAGVSIVSAPGALILNPADQSAGKFFVAGSDGHLWENNWDETSKRWIWGDHGTP